MLKLFRIRQGYEIISDKALGTYLKTCKTSFSASGKSIILVIDIITKNVILFNLTGVIKEFLRQV